MLSETPQPVSDGVERAASPPCGALIASTGQQCARLAGHDGYHAFRDNADPPHLIVVTPTPCTIPNCSYASAGWCPKCEPTLAASLSLDGLTDDERELVDELRQGRLLSVESGRAADALSGASETTSEDTRALLKRAAFYANQRACLAFAESVVSGDAASREADRCTDDARALELLASSPSPSNVPKDTTEGTDHE